MSLFQKLILHPLWGLFWKQEKKSKGAVKFAPIIFFLPPPGLGPFSVAFYWMKMLVGLSFFKYGLILHPIFYWKGGKVIKDTKSGFKVHWNNVYMISLILV